MHETLIQTMPKHITLNRIIRNLTKACVTKSSCINKRDNRSQIKLTKTMFLFGTLFVILFWKPALFPFSDSEILDMVDPLDRSILSRWTPWKQ
jgi:hypothetical protein